MDSNGNEFEWSDPNNSNRWQLANGQWTLAGSGFSIQATGVVDSEPIGNGTERVLNPGGTLTWTGAGTTGAGPTDLSPWVYDASTAVAADFTNEATSITSNGNNSSFVISSASDAQAAMTAIDSALVSVNAYMGDVGGYQNQLQYTINNLTTSIQDYRSSASTIEDADMASEVSNMTKEQILQQSAMAMLAQANAQPQSILKLLQNV